MNEMFEMWEEMSAWDLMAAALVAIVDEAVKAEPVVSDYEI
jgi:hypothetical protein